MTELAAEYPGRNLLPREVGSLRLSEVVPANISLIMPFEGAEAAVSEILTKACGMGFPKPNRTSSKKNARLVWNGLSCALLLGPPPDKALRKHAAVVDKTDGWLVMNLTGSGLTGVLARLTPLDLRPAHFRRGHASVSLLGHVPAVFSKIGAETFQIMVPRSMARTATEDLWRAMKSCTAQALREQD